MILKYYLFAWPDYYPVGGFGDFVGWFDSVSEAEQELLKLRTAPNSDEKPEGGEILRVDTDGSLSLLWDYWFTDAYFDETGEKIWHPEFPQARWVQIRDGKFVREVS